MADKVAKPKKSKSKAKKDDKGVLAALPSTRPERIGTRRTGATVAAATRTEAVAAQTAPQASASKPAKAASSKRAKAATSKPAQAASSKRAKAATSKPAVSGSSYPRKPKPAKPTAARRKAAAPRTFEPTEAAEAAAGKADERVAGVASRPRPRPVREGAPGMGTTTPDRDAASLRSSAQPADAGARSRESGRPSGVELVSTAVQAAGELTQIGLTIGGRIIKRAVDRLPKP